MTQAELNREVARATGETISEIGRRGFSFVDSDEVSFDPEPDDAGRYVDWDAVDAGAFIALAVLTRLINPQAALSHCPESCFDQSVERHAGVYAIVVFTLRYERGGCVFITRPPAGVALAIGRSTA